MFERKKQKKVLKCPLCGEPLHYHTSLKPRFFLGKFIMALGGTFYCPKCKMELVEINKLIKNKKNDNIKKIEVSFN